jgi:hypothetical protein
MNAEVELARGVKVKVGGKGRGGVDGGVVDVGVGARSRGEARDECIISQAGTWICSRENATRKVIILVVNTKLLRCVADDRVVLEAEENRTLG